MSSTNKYLHRFQKEINSISIPTVFTFPFCYDPDELSMLAAEQVQGYLLEQVDFEHNFGLIEGQSGLVIGKMFGVLVIQDDAGKLGFIAACSGKLAGKNQHAYFVPPIFDMLNPEGFFVKEEEVINALNRKIEALQSSPNFAAAKLELEHTKNKQQEKLASLRILHKENKAERKKCRSEKQPLLCTEDYQALLEDLIKQSYRDQHDYDVAKQQAALQIQKVESQLEEYASEIESLKQERKKRSATLQQQLFDQYSFLNANAERRDVLSIFQDAIQMLPPAGAGECAAPKLLQFAYEHKLTPISLAEFWWGASPASEVRKHRQYYPSCRGKCEPILNHMLQGLRVAPNPLLVNPAFDQNLEVIFEDDDILVVNKPAEFLSVPGIHIKDSVQTRILNRNPEISGPLIIHRLDMSTSGIMVLAKHKEAHQFIQDQFIRHTVIKRYTALLDGVIQDSQGEIDLPLRVDLDDRPRQVVCYTYGKPAKTRYEVQEVKDGKTRIHFYPLTGRTHQLRVHAAHSKGLDTAIVGDDLYGTRADRLHLHAGYISFIHPHSLLPVEFRIADPF